MDALSRDRRMRAFRATDAFAIEAYDVARHLVDPAHHGLAREIRRTAVRSGGAIVAASANARGGAAERELLERARDDLIESRYYLYLARRFGALDAKRYRALTARQDIALRELDALLGPARAAPRGEASLPD
jgi:four helix bundle protein